MQIFKIHSGPWKKLFAGKFQEQEIEVYSNPESMLLAVVYIAEGVEVKGTEVGLYKAFYCMGETEHFLASLPREALVLTRHSKSETLKFLLLSTTPEYVRWNEEEFMRETDKMLLQLKTATEIVSDVARAYDLQLKELLKAEPHIKESFFAEPLLVPMLTTSLRRPPMEAAEFTKHDASLGMTADKQNISEKLELLARTIVVEGTAKDRKHVLHVLAEAALLSNVPAVIFDFKGEFSSLAEPTADNVTLKEFEPEAEPFGFPVKTFRPIDDIVVDVSRSNAQVMMEAFGISNENIQRLLEKIIEFEKPDGMESIARYILSLEPTQEVHEYEIAKTIRLLKLIDLRYGRFFEGNNNMAEISKNWQRPIGRASIISLQGLDERQRLLLVHNIVAGILGHYKSHGRTQQLQSLIILPEAEAFVKEGSSYTATQQIAEMLLECQSYGIGFALSSANELDIKKDLRDGYTAHINVVEGNDVGVRLKDRKPYRVIIRPGQSKCGEK